MTPQAPRSPLEVQVRVHELIDQEPEICREILRLGWNAAIRSAAARLDSLQAHQNANKVRELLSDTSKGVP